MPRYGLRGGSARSQQREHVGTAYAATERVRGPDVGAMVRPSGARARGPGPNLGARARRHWPRPRRHGRRPRRLASWARPWRLVTPVSGERSLSRGHPGEAAEPHRCVAGAAQAARRPPDGGLGVARAGHPGSAGAAACHGTRRVRLSGRGAGAAARPWRAAARRAAACPGA
jgi:hypothetical protein